MSNHMRSHVPEERNNSLRPLVGTRFRPYGREKFSHNGRSYTARVFKFARFCRVIITLNMGKGLKMVDREFHLGMGESPYKYLDKTIEKFMLGII